MRGNTKKKLKIEGTVAPGFESVRKLYEHNMKALEEKNTPLCVYVGDHSRAMPRRYGHGW